MSTAQVFDEGPQQRLHALGPHGLPGPDEETAAGAGRPLTVLPGASADPTGPDAPLDDPPANSGGEGPTPPRPHDDGPDAARDDGDDATAPRAHGIRPAMHRWLIPRRERFAWRARLHANPASSLAYRIGVGVLGALLLILSALTGWLPGPGGIPLFLIGMAVLASEFRWAHRITVTVLMVVRHVECWSRRAKVIGVCVFGGVVVVCFYIALLVVGIPSWVPGWAVRLLSRLPGVG
ncbi:PGPGW domain-containing protein [Propionibacterium ruminifibrarum]|nr:PGPGW domain-containing protein [Propionibacterium ruminifibrarum]